VAEWSDVEAEISSESESAGSGFDTTVARARVGYGASADADSPTANHLNCSFGVLAIRQSDAVIVRAPSVSNSQINSAGQASARSLRHKGVS
jgi:hypothetical protein